MAKQESGSNVPGRTSRPWIEAFAVDDSSVQLVWRNAATGQLAVEVGERRLLIDSPASHGAIVVDCLPSGTSLEARLTFADGSASALNFTTQDALGGPVRCRVATLSDLHLGIRAFGLSSGIKDHSKGESAAVRCARAALCEAVAWGPDLIVFKGDVTNGGLRREWQQLAELLDPINIPVVILPGNHETAPARTIEPSEAAAEFGLRVVDEVGWVDLPGIRVALGTTLLVGRSKGQLDHRAEALVAAAADAPAALVVLHHHLQHRHDPFFWPPGIPRSQADRFLSRLAADQPNALITSGHTHRHRRHTSHGLTATQVGSTKDYPGVWAGYTVHDGGISQLVRRVSADDCLEWTDLTRRAMGGYWGVTSPGKLSDRCFTIRW